MKKLLFVIAILIGSTGATALLPPYYESTKEITAILNDPEIAKQIGSGRLIHSITRTDTGYTIEAGDCTLTVKVTYKPQPQAIVGPAIFELHPDALVCKPRPNPQ